MKVLTSGKIPIKMWLRQIETGALKQAKNLANFPFAFKHIAIMPDSHQGYGMPIGGVMATKGVIVPNAVGVDIGCGMCAIKTSITVDELDTETLKKIIDKIKKVIPVGFNKHKEGQALNLMPDYKNLEVKGDPKTVGNFEITLNIKNHPIIAKEYNNALKSLGTLGGGNHFIEIQKDNDDHIWIMIHSGSRNLGKQVAGHYNKIAKGLNEKWHTSVPKEHDLAFLPINNNEGKSYIREMNYCVEFALANRKLMMDRVLAVFREFFPDDGTVGDGIINIAHNYAKMENHFGQNVMVHRKGATLASKETIGIIPGSQGTKSYIVEGLGNPDSFNSCSHGAGRDMSRKEASRQLNLKMEIKKLDALGIIHSIKETKDLDEAPGAYKNINKVMEQQKNLVKILVELSPLGVIKG